MKNRSIKTQLILSFLTLSTLIIGALSIITLSLMNNHFNQYVEEKQKDILTQYVDTLDLIWENNQGSWQKEELNNLAKKALDNHVYFSIESPDKRIVWQLNTKQLNAAETKLNQHAKRVSSTKGVTLNQKVTTSRKLRVDEKEIGTVTFYYYGPFAYTEHDAMFISGMKRSLLLMGLVALIASLIFASWIAQKLSLPLKHVSVFTHQLTLGTYSKELPQETAIDEINLLIDSLNNLSNQLDKQAALRKRLTSDISHELRTPLTTLKGNVEAMIDGVWEVTPERLQTCYDEIDRLTRLIGNIELINQIEEKKQSLSLSYFNLTELTQSVIGNFSSKTEEKEIDITVNDEPIFVTADQDKLNQVLINLLSNALKFTQNNGNISFYLSQTKEMVSLTIKDNGIGIENDQLTHIFERFYMSDPSRNRALGGQGIGLAIVKGVIEAHNGVITVESKLGVGTSFHVLLPK